MGEDGGRGVQRGRRRESWIDTEGDKAEGGMLMTCQQVTDVLAIGSRECTQ